MKFVMSILVLAAIALLGANVLAYAAVAEESTVEEQLQEPLNPGDVQTEEELQSMGAPDAANPEMGGQESYDTYDEDTGIPQVTESDKLGEVYE